MSYPEKQYHRQETSKEYTKVYTLNNEDEIALKQSEDSLLGYASVDLVKSFRRNYGDFYDTTTQSGSADTAYAIKLNSTNVSKNISIVSGSRITPTTDGIYNIQFSAQLTNTANTNIHFDIWLNYTGSNVPYTNTQIDVNKTAGALGRVVAAWNLVKEIKANDYVELMWSCSDTTGQLYATGSNEIHPGIPSVITTITQIS